MQRELVVRSSNMQSRSAELQRKLISPNGVSNDKGRTAVVAPQSRRGGQTSQAPGILPGKTKCMSQAVGLPCEIALNQLRIAQDVALRLESLALKSHA